MKFPTQHIKKLTLAITKAIVVGVVFVVSVSIGVFNILMKSTEHKVNAKTRIVSDESKIHPKNTNDRDIFGYPDRSVK
jgi:hypothetical protein